MSTESGIPDYRSPNRPAYRPLQHGEFVSQPAVRRRYWARSTLGYPRMAATLPNDSHKLLAKLHGMGVLSRILTQNVDGHHQAAGPSVPTLQLHGSVHSATCANCGWSTPRPALQDTLTSANAEWLAEWAAVDGAAADRPDGDRELPDGAVAAFRPPVCPSCGGDSIRPDVIFHGGAIPGAVTEAAAAAVADAGALLILGTTLSTWSAFRLARQAAASGTPMAVVSFGPTRADGLHPAPLKLETATSPVLHALVQELQR